MKWALVATVPTEILNHNQPEIEEGWSNQEIKNAVANHPKTVIVEAGQIMTFIEYDGQSDYSAPQGTRLEQVGDDKNVGDAV